MRNGNTNALPRGARNGDVVLYTGGNSGNFPQLDLDVFDLTINGLSSAVSNTTSTTLPKVTSLSATAGTSTMTLGDNNANGSYDGTIANGTTRTVALKKIGGSISPGNGLGILTLNGGLSVAAGETCLWELAANSTNNPGTDFDQIVVGGGVLSLAIGSHLSLRFAGTATAPAPTNAFWLQAAVDA